MSHKTREVAETEVIRVTRDFGVKDRFGRTIGAKVFLREVTMEAIEDACRLYYSTMAPGHYFCMSVTATRDDVPYGAVQMRQYFTTEAERTATMEKYFAGAAKRAAKRAGK